MDKNITVNDITWDRIWLGLHTNAPAELKLQSVDGHYSARLLHSDTLEGPQDETLHMLNITNPGDCKMLPVGIYRFVTEDGSDVISSTNISPRSISRQFIYFHRERAYRIQFSTKDGLKIKVTDVELNKKKNIKTVLSSVKHMRYNLAKSILRTIYNTEYLLLHRRNTERILLFSDQSEQMGANMLAFNNALLRAGYSPDESLRSVTTKHYSILHWVKTLAKLAKANYIFLDDHSQTTDWLKLKGAMITQLWHSGAGFKSTGYSRFGLPASPAPESGHRQYNYGIAGSRRIRHFYSDVWGINETMVLPTGMPRLDEFLDDAYRKSKTDELNNSDFGYHNFLLCKQRRVILFAPTYRGENKKAAYYPYEKVDLKQLHELCEKTDSVVLFKMHPFVEKGFPIPEEYTDRMIDVTTYPNINDLFYITDLLITDYSSNIYEFSLMKKPMLFYAFDQEDYLKDRGFHRDFASTAPGKIVTDYIGLHNAILANDFEFEKVEKYVEESYDFIDSHACDRIIDYIIKGNIPEEIKKEIEEQKKLVTR